MIKYQEFFLENGLQVIYHEDHSAPIAVLNLLYKVGSRNESELRTGFAHLFEHLMFGGSKHIESFDEPLQLAGGENNAFTSTDLTNYYITIPTGNIETAFWLESDRMMSLSFDPKVLEVQRSVVIEEFKQRYLNQPYGDAWLQLRPLAFKTHAYKWATIGKDISHIEHATMEDVKEFFFKYYLPNNAVLVIGGDITFEKAKALTEKWFGPIKKGNLPDASLPAELEQKEERRMEVKAKVPLDAIYKVFHMPGKTSDDYYPADLLSDILGRGKSSRLYTRLVKEKEIFNSISSHVMGSMDPGLLVIEGKLNQGISVEDGETEINKIVEELLQNGVAEDELVKVKNQAESTIEFEQMELLNRAMALAFAAFLGNPEIVNQETKKIAAITSSDIMRMAKQILRKENSSTLIYRAEN